MPDSPMPLTIKRDNCDGVERIEIENVALPQDIQWAVAAVAQTTRVANAKVIAAKGELGFAQPFQQVAQNMSSIPATLQLCYLQTLATSGGESNSNIVFPQPTEITSAFRNKKN
ncbi:Erythrocyte band 7 integral membrane protein [Fasciolopsis buskii]|uniref:Erythrocyte band 7 integral membrane protein n=1 Tax=Fasciolopsis buskii TaxID=27845 RepID=A0A8E0RVU4_9TREM|nr:Erythrocyte band 7 integral membrane protein [Fasciolopsis buski]